MSNSKQNGVGPYRIGHSFAADCIMSPIHFCREPVAAGQEARPFYAVVNGTEFIDTLYVALHYAMENGLTSKETIKE